MLFEALFWGAAPSAAKALEAAKPSAFMAAAEGPPLKPPLSAGLAAGTSPSQPAEAPSGLPAKSSAGFAGQPLSAPADQSSASAAAAGRISKKKPENKAGDTPKTASPFQKCQKSSGGEVLLRESAKLDFYIKFNSFNSENIKKVVNAILAAGGKSRCPAGCLQENSYKIYVTVRHASTVRGGGCPADQARESYSFKKEFAIKTGDSSPRADSAKPGEKAASKKAAMLESGRQMNKWLAKTFVYPYLPFPLRSSTKEHRQTLKSACPSCSFQLAYDYVFAADGRLSLNLDVKCGALKESLLSPLKIELAVSRRWQCKPPKPAGKPWPAQS